MKVLIAEDDRDSLYMLETLLRGNGWQVAAARTGAEALERARDEAPDLIVSDILMPVMDGFQFCRAVREDDALHFVPFIFYTATYIDPKDRDLAMSIGADRFLVKPMEPEELLGAIREVIDERGAAETNVEYPTAQDLDFLRRHNQALFRKLDKKISDLEKANESVRRSERRLGDLLENLSLATLILSPDGTVVFCNPFLLTLAGRTESEAYGRNWLDLFVPEELHAEHAAAIEKVFRASLPREFEGEVATRDGDRRLFAWNACALRADDGRADTVALVGVDVTDHRKTEEQLRHSQKMEALGTMAGGVAHDFNNILTVILGCSSLLKLGTEKGSKNEALLNEVVASVERGAEMTRSLLAFSRKQPANLQPRDVNEVLSELEKSLRRLIREDVEFRVALSGDPVPVLLDRSQLEQVIVNLVINARDAMPSGGILSVSLSIVDIPDGNHPGPPPPLRPGRYGLMTVSDTGTGMDPETRERAFEPFFTTKEAGKGTGLGLSIVYGIVIRHGGHIELASEKGHGTTLRIYLPLLADDEAAKVGGPEDEVPRGQGTILLVEDEDAVREITGVILENNGFRVLYAQNGEAGLSAFLESRDDIALIVSDLIMPRMNGRQMYDEIFRIRPGVPVIFLSGYADNLYPDGAVDDGVSKFLQKPLRPSALLKAVHDAMDRAARNVPESPPSSARPTPSPD